MMRRKIYDELLTWKERSRGSSAILIEGARRVGKSYIVEEFARNEYDSYILINFRRVSTDVKHWFDIYMEDIGQLLRNIQLHYNRQLTPRRSVIIFDEVQACPRAREAIKFLVEDGRFDYIETGSLISIKKNTKGIVLPSEEEKLDMFPMDFEEFLWAMGNHTIMPYIRECFADRKPLVQALHRKAMDLFRLYVVVGGMPQAVLAYVDTNDFQKVEDAKRRILQLYRNDIHQFADNLENKVAAIFDAIPGQLQKHEKKFSLAVLGEDARMRDYDSAFLWLADARIINICFNTTAPNIGLKLNEDRTTLKLYMGDTGLLISHSFDEHGRVPIEIYQKLILGKLEINEGMIIENVVSQMLRAAGHKLFFFSKYSHDNADKRMEIDFLIAKSKITSRHNISPIEVKSGKRYTLTSLRKLQEQYSMYLSDSFVMHDANVRQNEGITYLPIYMTICL